MWYNQTDFALKGLVASGAWSSATSSTNGGSSRIGFGIQTAGIAAGGATAPGNQTVVEEYNGIGWSTETAMPTDRQDGGGAGTTTAGLVWCGEGPAKLNTTQEYDGSSWTTTGNYPITARGVRGSGTQTAAIGDGGDTPAPAASNVSAEYNGSTWTAGNNLPTNRVAAATSGTQTAALATTGKDAVPNASVSNYNTSYDGTSWTVETVYPLSLRQAVSTGTSSSANLVAGGLGNAPFGSAVTAANVWNGSSWTAVGDLGTKSTHGNGAGSSTASYINSGAQDYPSYPSVTQEYNFSTNIITPGAWASGGNLGTARRGSGSGKNSQTLTAGLVFGGGGSPYGPIGIATEEYDGSSFSGGGNMNTPRYLLGGAGTQTSALGAGGYSYPPPASIDAVEEYNGSSWTNVTSLPQIRQDMSSFGTQTAAILASGRDRPGSVTYSTTLSYNGTSWTALGSPANVNTARIALSGSGTQTAGLATGGNSSPYKQTEEWNGSTWTSQNSSINEHNNVQSSQLGIQTNALICGGGPSPTTATEGYDGTSWSTRPSMATGRYNSAGGGSATSGFIAGGFTTANTAATEEFTGETVSANIKTFTTS
jgi:hypothetical protein